MSRSFLIYSFYFYKTGTFAPHQSAAQTASPQGEAMNGPGTDAFSAVFCDCQEEVSVPGPFFISLSSNNCVCSLESELLDCVLTHLIFQDLACCIHRE